MGKTRSKSTANCSTKVNVTHNKNDITSLIENNQNANKKLIDDLRTEVARKFECINIQIRTIQDTNPSMNAKCNSISSAVVPFNVNIHNSNSGIDRLASYFILASRELNTKIATLQQNNNEMKKTLTDIIEMVIVNGSSPSNQKKKRKKSFVTTTNN